MHKRLNEYPKWVQWEALKTAEFSRAAYGTKGYTLDNANLIENKKTDTQCYVFREDDIVYTIFRGTEKKLRDIITDILFFRKHIPYDHTGEIRVHSGFYKAYTGVHDQVRNRVRELLLEGANKVVTAGHSMGGDLQALCAVDLVYNSLINRDDIRSYAFNMAKLGNKHFVESFNKRVRFALRIKNTLDPVSAVPPFWKHIGNKIRLRGKVGHDINNCIYNIKKVIYDN